MAGLTLPSWPFPLSCSEHFGLAVEYGNVYELDSSTDAKFSRHLLIRIPGHAFANNHAMSQFITHVSPAPSFAPCPPHKQRRRHSASVAGSPALAAPLLLRSAHA